MDQLFLDLIGKPKLNAPKLISIIVENFSLLEDQARFLKATLAIPQVKKLPFSDGNKRLVQIGNLPSIVGDQLKNENWTIHKYDRPPIDDIIDAIANDLSCIHERSIIFINDLSRLQLLSKNPRQDMYKLLLFVNSLKCNGGHFVILLHQSVDGSISNESRKLIRDMECLSDGVVKIKTCVAGYFKQIWCQPVVQTHSTLLPPKTETSYYTCKIGQDFWSPNLLCFYDKKKIPKNYNLHDDSYIQAGDSDNESDSEATDNKKHLTDKSLDCSNRASQTIDSQIDVTTASILRDEDDHGKFSTSVRPFMTAQNPERSQIFYYPDKDDDFDEDDPDSDLNI